MFSKIQIRGRGCERVLEYMGTRSPGIRVKHILKAVYLIPMHTRIFIYYYPCILHIVSKFIYTLNMYIYNNIM
jgi:hypothetical protein